jgi:sulfite exporter TauE/SafE
LLQSALMVAALANSPVSGAMVMVAFAVASSVALGLAPTLWLKWVSGDASRGVRVTMWVTRLSGAALAAAAAWALGHDLWVRIAAYCFS